MNGVLATGGMSLVGIIIMYVVIIGGFWFLLMRPQKKEQKRVQLMLSELAVGCLLYTSVAGLFGLGEKQWNFQRDYKLWRIS